jgi:hypothetical protein
MITVKPGINTSVLKLATTVGQATTVGHISEGKPLVLLQVNCRSICNKTLEFWNLIDTYNPDVVIGTESWLSEEISSAEIFRDDYITFRRDRGSRGVECSFV